MLKPIPACLLYVLLPIFFVLSLSAGLSAEATRNGADAKQAGRRDPISIEAAMFEGGLGLEFYITCAREYEKMRPGVKVNMHGDPRIADKVRVRILEGKYPEMSNAEVNYWELIRQDKILALDEFLDGPNWEGDGTWRDSFLPGSLDSFTHEAKVYAIPLHTSTYVIWYNKNMFRERGWTPPKTWDEFFELCEKIKKTGTAPLAFQGRYVYYSNMLLNHAYYHLAGRERFYDQQNLEPGSFDNPEMIKALGLLQKTALEYFQSGAMGMSHTEAQMQWLLGRTAMVPCGDWLKSEMKGKIPDGFKFGAFNIPQVPNTKGDPTAVQKSAGTYKVFKNSLHAREAVDFLRFMTSRRMASLFARSRDIPTAVRGANKGNLTADMDDLVEILDQARSSFGTPPGEGYPDMQQYESDVRADLLTGAVTPKKAAERLEAAARMVRLEAAYPDRVTVRHVWKPIMLAVILCVALFYWVVTQVLKIRAERREKITGVRSGLPVMKMKHILVFVGPAALFYAVFVVVPSLRSFSWCVQRWNGLSKPEFVGLLNFKRLLLESDAFWIALGNNLFIMCVIPLFVLPLSLFFAACISRGVRGKKIFRVVFFFPNILGVVAASILWMYMYNPQGGPINVALSSIGRFLLSMGLTDVGGWFVGFDGFAWLSQENLYWALVPMSAWAACGFNMVLFLAAMESIPQSLYEAAEVDGASHWTQFRKITLPLIREVLAIAMVFMVIGGMKAFETIWLLTNQRPTTGNHVIGTRIVQTMFQEFKVGQATAIAVLLFFMIFFGGTAVLRLMKRDSVEF